MDQFKDLHEAVKGKLSEVGFKKPTAVQRKALPKVLEGRDSLLIAPTGTGKTEAALLPIFSQFMEGGADKEGIRIIYIAPLRALNRDMLDRLQKWSDFLDIDIQVRHGDTTQYQRRKQALDPPDMLITTPETLQAILPGSRMKEHLEHVNWTVIDEVHELAESKRGVQLTIGLERLARLAEDFQRIGLSATIGDEEKVAEFLVGGDKNVEIIDASSAEEMSISVKSPMPTENDAELSDELNAEPSMIARLRVIRDLILKHDSTLTFVNTRQSSETLGSRLKFWDSDFPIRVHHGSLARDYRISSEEDFRDGELKSLICTSSMELGIDIGNIDFVIQYGSPRQVKRLIQRIGRSGHGVERSSEGTVIATDPDDVMESKVIAERAHFQDLEKTKIHENSLDVLSHQIVGFVLDGLRDPRKIFELVRNANPYRSLSEGEFKGVVQQLTDQGILWYSDGELGSGRRTWKYYYNNLSMIPDIKHYQIQDMVSGESIGTLDEEFVVSKVELGTTFICKGEAWRVVEVEDEKVRVEPTDDPYGAIPSWEGELIPVDFHTAQEVGELHSKIEEMLEDQLSDEEIAEEIGRDHVAEEDALEWAAHYLREQKEEGPIPTRERLVLEKYKHFVVLHASFGTTVNRTFAQILSALISTRIGTSVGIKSDPYRIAFRFPNREDTDAVAKTLEELEPEHLEPILKKVLGKSSIFRWRLLHVAKRFGGIEKDADFSEIRGKRLVEAYKDTPLWTEAEREVRHEKMDVSRLQEMIELQGSGEIRIKTIRRGEKQGPTPVSLPILNELASGGELVVPERAERKIIETLKRRLRNEQVKLFCLNCMDWSTLTRVRRLDEQPTCGNCEARYLALVPKRGGDVITALRKEKREKDLSDEERQSAKRARDTANLVLTHGKKAVTAMAGRGVGPATASRILAMQYKDERSFYRAILRAERKYARTHQFWDT